MRIAVPGRGRLRDGSVRLLTSAGIDVPAGLDRTLVADSPNSNCQLQFVRARDVVELVRNGSATLGITGRDILAEYGGDSLRELIELDFGRCSLCIAAPEGSPYGSETDFRDGMRVATKYPRIVQQYFSGLGLKIEPVLVSGNTEVAPRIGIADVIADIVETGNTLRANGLEVVSEVLTSSAVIVGRAKVAEENCIAEDFLSTVRSVLDAKKRRYLTVNVPEAALETVKRQFAGAEEFTVTGIIGIEGTFSLQAVVAESDINRFVSGLKKSGCSRIVVSPLERFIA